MAKTRKSISLASAVDKSRLSSGHTFMMLLDVEVVDPFTGAYVETIRIANGVPLNGDPEPNPIAVYWGGNSYQCAAFDITIEESAGDLPQVQLSANDIGGVIRDKMNLYSGGVGFGVKLYIVHTSELFGATPGESIGSPHASTSEIEETFLVTNGSVTGAQITFKLGDKNELAKAFPRRRQLRDFCQWRYKGEQCRYVGGLTSCDRTLQGANGCATHVNTENFGGFPSLQPRFVR